MTSTMSVGETCWCGGLAFDPSPHPDYRVCRECGTAKLRDGLATGQNPVTDETLHLYGEQYWNEHMRQYGYPPLADRARADMAERCQYWLGRLLPYRLPPARTLELGCAHGGFVKLLAAAGYAADGIEMSPGIIAKARQWFGIDVIRGPLEYADRPIGTYDVVLLFDVIEHFADPVATMRAVVERVAPDGLVVIQTPNYDDVGDRTWFQFKPPEHTFLFTSASLKSFFARLGFGHVVTEPALFKSDQFVFASRVPIPAHQPEAVANALAATPDGRLVLALQDLYHQVREQQNPDPAARFGLRALGAAMLRAIPRAIARRLRHRP